MPNIYPSQILRGWNTAYPVTSIDRKAISDLNTKKSSDLSEEDVLILTTNRRRALQSMSDEHFHILATHATNSQLAEQMNVLTRQIGDHKVLMKKKHPDWSWNIRGVDAKTRKTKSKKSLDVRAEIARLHKEISNLQKQLA